MSIIWKKPDKSGRRKPGPGRKNILGLVWTWVDERTNFSGPIHRFLAYPVPKYVHNNLLYSLGGLTLITISLQIATGVLLSFYYDPSLAGAYNSVDYVTYQLPLGWLIRGLHYYNASAIVILMALHMLRTFSFGAYKKPREITWLSGVLLLLITLGFAFTGYLLPWDQRGYWATKVGTEIAGSAPLIGEWQARLIRGGPELGQATLTRFYVTHMLLLPGALILLMGLHIYQLRYHGPAPPLTNRGRALATKFVPFFPHWIMVDALLGVGLLAGLIFLGWSYRVPLSFPADPSSTDFLPRPEWYFLFLFQLLKYFPGPWEPVAAFGIPLLVVGSMLLLPFLDRSEERRPWRKPITTSVATLYVVMVVGLTFLALRADQQVEEIEVVAAAAADTSEVPTENEPAIATEAEPESEPQEEMEQKAEEIEAEPEPAVEAETEPEIETEEESEDRAEAAPQVEVNPVESEVKLIEPVIVPATSPASLAPLSDRPNTLIALAIEEAMLDGYAEFWAEAPRLVVATQGAKAALSGSDQKTGPLVALQAVYDAQTLVVRAEWLDETESVLKNAWLWQGDRFIKRGNEDRIALLWPIGNNAQFASKGCAFACHRGQEDDDWWMGAEDDSVRYDAWHWQAARTNPVGQANDEWWATLTDLEDTDSSRHGDALDSGGYQENVAEDQRGPALMHATNLAAPFIPAGQAVPLDTAQLDLDSVVPGYILAPFIGSRGDISARGWWVEGMWVVVLQRALNTGQDDDAVFIPGKRLPFGLAVFDNTDGIRHNVAPEVLILEWN